MIENQNKVDDADRVYLIGAMCLANERENAIPEGEIARVGVTEVGRFFGAAQFALTYVECLHRQHEDDWDGVAWYEHLCDASAGTLADRLVGLVQRLDEAPTSDEVRVVVIEWLNAAGL